MTMYRPWTAIGAAGLLLICLSGQALAAENAAVDREPADLLTLAKGAVLVEASHKRRDALALIDGDPKSTWNIAAIKKPGPYRFTFELLAPARLSAVGVGGAGPRPGGVAGGSAKTVTVEGARAPRGGTFERLATVEAAPDGVTLTELSGSPEVQALRFTVEAAHSAEAAFWYVAEFVAQGAMSVPETEDRYTGVFATGRSTHIELKQDGIALTGCYSDNGGRSFGALTGSVVDGVALLEWKSQENIAGTAVLTVDSEGALSGVRYRHRSRSPWGGPRASEDVTTPCSEDRTPANPILEALDTQGEAKIYGILFNHDSDVPRSISLPALELLREALEARPALRVVIEGHTDSDGADAYNLDLSARRAAAVVAWLTERGIAADRLRSEGKGEGEPVASNDKADGKALNRRVEVAVIK